MEQVTPKWLIQVSRDLENSSRFTRQIPRFKGGTVLEASNFAEKSASIGGEGMQFVGRTLLKMKPSTARRRNGSTAGDPRGEKLSHMETETWHITAPQKSRTMLPRHALQQTAIGGSHPRVGSKRATFVFHGASATIEEILYMNRCGGASEGQNISRGP